ncbi:alpha amylase [Colletotrichum scovillei]|uniref:alpha amylase n=1 Tax=Colletotrichum scovillei TaxID=1209932 RepID=UPI0015C3F761|nr:alpha amylase [Colletotrichum scovillei]KAF4784519.1 alpha amylase [Colletotrichum scovillei]
MSRANPVTANRTMATGRRTSGRSTPRFGTAEDLIFLADAIHARGMYLMADVVTNHMAWLGPGNTVDYSIYRPFSNASAYHTPCVIDYSNQDSVERCWQGTDAASLPDLRTEDPRVRQVFNAWIKREVRRFGFDGLRLDSAKHVEPSFWPAFEASAGVAAFGEVFHGDPVYVAPYQDVMSGVMNYPVYYWLTQAFQSTTGSIWNLSNGIKTLIATARDLTLYGGFLENHDQPRFLNHTSDRTLLKNALTFSLLMDGIPIIYQGLEQGSTAARHRTTAKRCGRRVQHAVGALSLDLQVRVPALDAGGAGWRVPLLQVPAHPHGRPHHCHAQGLRRRAGCERLLNVGTNRTYSVSLAQEDTGFRPCKLILEVVQCRPYVTDATGVLKATSGSGEPLVFVPADKVMGTGICAGGIGKRPPPPPPPRRHKPSPPPPPPSGTSTATAARFSTTRLAVESTDYNLDSIGRFNNITLSPCLTSQL